MKHPTMTAAVLALASIGVIAGVISAGASLERVPVIRDQLVKTECGACHMAYQPWFLPANSWRKIMSGLPDHFGEDASLDESTRQKITQYLIKHAGRGSTGAGITITGLGWYKNEHRGEVSAKALKKAGSMANCTACHSDADRGLYDDD